MCITEWQATPLGLCNIIHLLKLETPTGCLLGWLVRFLGFYGLRRSAAIRDTSLETAILHERECPLGIRKMDRYARNQSLEYAKMGIDWELGQLDMCKENR